MKRKGFSLFMFLTLVLCMAFQTQAAEVVTTGECGESATYTLYDDGHLVISGNGEILIDPETTAYTWSTAITPNTTSVTIEEGITSIGFNTFYGCPVLEEVNLPGTLTQIGGQAFGECSALTGILLPESLEVIGENAFYKAGLTEITIPDSVTTIGFQAFYGTKLTSLVIPESVTSLGSQFAWACNDLKNFEIYCGGTYEMVTRTVETVIIGGNITAIDDMAFYENTNLKSVTIGNNVTSIGEMAFQGCGLTSIVIPDSVTTIGPYCFNNCANLEEVVIGKGLVADFTIDDFASSYNLKTVKIDGSGITLGDSMFSCHPSLSTVILGDGVTSIGGYAFLDCDALTEIQFGTGLTQIGEAAFAGCGNLTGSFTIPGRIHVIPERAFEDTGFSEIILEEGIETICGSAFLGVPITTLEIPDSVTEIASDSFHMCKELTSITIGSGLKHIPENAFYYLPKLTTLTLSEGLETIGEHAFGNDTALLEVVIPDSVTSLGECVFQDCSGIERLTIGSGVEYINWGMFYNCTEVKEITLKEGIKSIVNAFSSMSKVGRFIIPASVENFSICDHSPYATAQFIFLGDAPEFIGPKTFNSSLVFYYPQSNETWIDFVIPCGNGEWQLHGYHVNEHGSLIPESPELEDILTEIEGFSSFDFVEGSAYPDNYRYIINGNRLEASGAEAFAFELSDACAGFLPISEHLDVVYADLQISDLLYDGDAVWVITGKTEDKVTVSGAVDEVVVHDHTLTRSEVEGADSYRTRYGLSLLDYEMIPYTSPEIVTDPNMPINESAVYDRIMALQEKYPHGMSWTNKNVYKSKHSYWIGNKIILNDCQACGAFGAILRDTAFGDLEPRCVEYYGSVDFDQIMVGDSLIFESTETELHEVIVTEVYSNYVVVAEGNLNEKISWGRIFTREEVEKNHARVTSYPEGTVAPEREYKELPKEEGWVPEINPDNPDVTPDAPAFSDVPATEYYAAPVAWAASMGITTGTSETTFSPGNDCTRGQIVTFIWRAKGEPEPKSTVNPFTDVKSTDYFYKAVLWAVEQGITNGISANEFGPSRGCTRAQVATFLWRAQGEPEAAGKNPFKDVKKGDYYYEAVIWAVENGVTTGTSAITFAPNNTCTRGQIVTFLYRAIA